MPVVSSRFSWVAGASAVVLILVSLAYLYYQREVDHIKEHKHQELAAIADLKSDQIQGWRDRQLLNIVKISTSPLVQKAVEEYAYDPSLQRALEKKLQHERKSEGLDDFLLLSPRGEILFSAEQRPDPLSGATLRTLEQTRKTGAAALSDLYRGPRGFVELSAVAPVFATDRALLANMVARVNAERFLFPLVQSWPVPSASAETLIVQKDGEDVLFLTKLRHWSGAPLSLRIPLTRTDVPAVRAVLGLRGTWRGPDYRGVEVLSELRAIPGSPWIMVTKIDAREIFAQARYRAGMVGSGVALLFALAIVLMGYYYHRRQAGLLLERVQAVDALRASEQVLRTQFDNSPDIILILDRQIKIATINHGIAGGHTAEQLVGRDGIEILPPEERERVRRYIAEVFATGQMRDFEHEIGLGQWAHARVVPLPSKGAVENVMVISTDITEQKRAEQERQRLRSQLLQSQKMESIGTLAGGIAHDFNNLLAGIMGSLSLMELQIGDHFEFRDDLREMKAQVNRGAELTRQLLGFARRGKYDAKPFDINVLVQKTSQMFSRMRRNVVVSLQCSPQVQAVEADQSQLEQVLLNLLVNAGEAMPNGGELSIGTERVELSLEKVAPYRIAPGRFAKISIADTGVGMSQTTLERIFEPFFTTKEMGRGTGLGLASAYGVIKNHGGFISVQSDLGRGTTFTIYLPITDKQIVWSDQPPAEAQGAGEMILVVDDEEHIVKTCNRLLKATGYQVCTARSGQEAVELVQQNPTKFALVLLDLVMPGMDGGQTFDALRKLNPAIKVILSSGYSVEGEATEILERGCNGFLQKPYSIASLSAKIREVL
jgi:PAS domain S-box-containing protein